MTCPTYPNPLITAVLAIIIVPFLIWSVFSIWQERHAMEEMCAERGGQMERVTYSDRVEWQCVNLKGIK